MFKIGDRVIWKPVDYRNGSQNTNHRWYGATGTVIECDRFMACICLDDFPEVNSRKFHNRFWADFQELERCETD